MDENEIARVVVDACFKVHTTLGPGLLESAYKTVLSYELRKRRLVVASEVGCPVVYDGVQFDEGYRLDLLVNDLVVVELKSIEAVLDVHKKQVLTYLKLSGKRLGLLVNFNESLIKSALHRI